MNYTNTSASAAGCGCQSVQNGRSCQDCQNGQDCQSCQICQNGQSCQRYQSFQNGQGCQNIAPEGMPDSFPIAMAYVPWQTWKQPYSLDQGLKRGTIFPELDLPFVMGRCI